MLLGWGSGYIVEPRGIPSPHYTMVENTCDTCHVGESANHTFEPDIAACQACHPGAEDFDINGVQTEVQESLDQLQAALTAIGLLDADGEIVVGSYYAPYADALWNWIYIAHEDKSLGVHNPTYTRDTLKASLNALSELEQ
jgi:hypothetical protein